MLTAEIAGRACSCTDTDLACVCPVLPDLKLTLTASKTTNLMIDRNLMYGYGPALTSGRHGECHIL